MGHQMKVKLYDALHFLGLITPLIISLHSVWLHSVLLALTSLVCMFVMAAILPEAKHRECVWIFVMSSLSFAPLNIWLLQKVIRLIPDPVERNFLNNLWAVFWYGILFGLEEIFTGIVARLLWKKQYKSIFSD